MAGRICRGAIVLCVSVFGVCGGLSAAASNPPEVFVSASNPSETPPAPTTLVPDLAPPVSELTTTETSLSLTSTNAPTTTTTISPDASDTNTDLVESLGVVVMLALDGATLPDPDSACIAAAIAATNPDVRGGAAEVAADPTAWWQIAPETRLPIMTAYLDFAGIGAVANMLALDTINSTEAAPCIAQAWSGLLTTDAIASSNVILGRAR
jgi:hypothetical protein